MPIKFIGRTTDFQGKTLWEILGNLKNFGVGRMVMRNRFNRYPEPSYMKILKVGALPVPTEQYKDRKVMALVEMTFRGQTATYPIQIDETSYKADFKLIPKDQEHEYIHFQGQREIKIVPKTMNFPPLLKELIIQQKKETGEPLIDDPKLTICYNTQGFKAYRVAEENEDVQWTSYFGTTVSPNLYANIKSS